MKDYSELVCMGYPVFTDRLGNLSNNDKLVISTINQYSYCLAEKDDEFQRSLLKSDVLLPDGIGIVLASQFLYGQRIRKIAGADLHNFLLKKLEGEGGSCFYMGSSEETLSRIRTRIAKEFPNIRVGTYSPPFKPELSEKDNLEIREAVNSFRPDVLFVGMTAPKQEKWSFEQSDMLDAKMICSIGAVFDFYAGTVSRPGDFWINSGLEWVRRLIKEPGRMWKRYIVYGAQFGYYLLKQKLNGAHNQNGTRVRMES